MHTDAWDSGLGIPGLGSGLGIPGPGIPGLGSGPRTSDVTDVRSGPRARGPGVGPGAGSRAGRQPPGPRALGPGPRTPAPPQHFGLELAAQLPPFGPPPLGPPLAPAGRPNPLPAPPRQTAFQLFKYTKLDFKIKTGFRGPPPARPGPGGPPGAPSTTAGGRLGDGGGGTVAAGLEPGPGAGRDRGPAGTAPPPPPSPLRPPAEEHVHGASGLAAGGSGGAHDLPRACRRCSLDETRGLGRTVSRQALPHGGVAPGPDHGIGTGALRLEAMEVAYDVVQILATPGAARAGSRSGLAPGVAGDCATSVRSHFLAVCEEGFAPGRGRGGPGPP